MAKITINISEQEKVNVMRAIKQLNGKTTSVNEIADKAGYNPNRTRFIVDDLLEDGRITREVKKKFNDKYIRYSYSVV